MIVKTIQSLSKKFYSIKIEKIKKLCLEIINCDIVKQGLNGLTKYTAAYWANKNVRCNAIAPGGIFNHQDKTFLKKIKKVIPLKRLAKKNEYNELILFLCSDSSSYMTGSIVIADGGRTII